MKQKVLKSAIALLLVVVMVAGAMPLVSPFRLLSEFASLPSSLPVCVTSKGEATTSPKGRMIQTMLFPLEIALYPKNRTQENIEAQKTDSPLYR